jgi:gas vesicle protein
MPTRAASTADEIAESIKSLIERVADAKLTQEMARRSQEMAEAIAERGADVGDRASDAWRESRPLRRDAAKRLARASRDASRWSDTTWKRSVRPTLKDLWSRRTVALGAAGAAVPAGREIVDTAAVRLGLKEREERHWGAFFLGLVLGAIGGAVAALLLAPKRGSEIRQDLATRADEMVTRAKDAEWVPMFQRDEPTNGHSADAIGDAAPSAGASTTEAAADAGAATGERADIAADETAEAINESYDTVDRESTT